jgi:hypothetical protein
VCGGGYSVMSYWIDVRQVCTPSPSPHATRQATNTNIKRRLRCTSRARSHVLGTQQPPDDFAGDVFGEPFSTCFHRLRHKLVSAQSPPCRNSLIWPVIDEYSCLSIPFALHFTC